MCFKCRTSEHFEICNVCFLIFNHNLSRTSRDFDNYMYCALTNDYNDILITEDTWNHLMKQRNNLLMREQASTYNMIILIKTSRTQFKI